ncbi:unnamed protein product [Calicophoron daubneyi]|uniref:Ubiquitin carboxyl-terminal hydrolase n=1 Tax=Calicophoron daubneyi TaxID=300641 RepID=A0AAV2T6D2_CALDB
MMSSTAAVVSSVAYHLPNQGYSSFESAKKGYGYCGAVCSNPTTDDGRNGGLNASPGSGEPQTSFAKVNSEVAKEATSNLDSALRTSLKPWIRMHNSAQPTESMTSAYRSLSFHESTAPSLDTVIRQRIQALPKSLIITDAEPPKDNKGSCRRLLCTDSELEGWCRSGVQHVPRQSLGLGNAGNTCYLNSVLQCILATGPLLAYVSARHSNPSCCMVSTGQTVTSPSSLGKSRFCGLCGLFRLLREHSQRIQSTNGLHPTSSLCCGQTVPSYFVSNVRAVCPSLRPYQQEDAHEFLLGLLSRMEDSSMAGLGKLPRSVMATNVIRRIFGTMIRSEVTCHSCNKTSCRNEPNFNLSVDITCARSLQQCLFNYIRSEELCGQNAYKCENCGQLRAAAKRSTIFQGGPILIIQLNRFSRHQKLDTRIEFPSSFNLRPFMTENKGPPVLYRLYATVNHEGYSCRSGHYVAFTRRNGLWLSHNDSFVNSTNSEYVLRQAPYLLFYEAVHSVFKNGVQRNETSSKSSSNTAHPVNRLVNSNQETIRKQSVPVVGTAENPTSIPLSSIPLPPSASSSVIPHTISKKSHPTLPVITEGRCSLSPTSCAEINGNASDKSPSASVPISDANACKAELPPLCPEPAHESTTIPPVTASAKPEHGPILVMPPKPSVVTPISSATIRELLYGNSSSPDLWTERCTPLASDLMGSPTQHSKTMFKPHGTQNSSPVKRSHSPDDKGPSSKRKSIIGHDTVSVAASSKVPNCQNVENPSICHALIRNGSNDSYLWLRGS